ncbi:hypothetical protein [Aureimonas sp. SK2]|uniref:hypothetical protein n=1 Tax=Aureimonas sp. SK2 TaxID=3015992 RepID=UPI00244472B6|nr:hypothetical protein [Aureimonas sp. SK2]
MMTLITNASWTAASERSVKATPMPEALHPALQEEPQLPSVWFAFAATVIGGLSEVMAQRRRPISVTQTTLSAEKGTSAGAALSELGCGEDRRR